MVGIQPKFSDTLIVNFCSIGYRLEIGDQLRNLLHSDGHDELCLNVCLPEKMRRKMKAPGLSTNTRDGNTMVP